MHERSRFYSTRFLLTLIVVLLCVDSLAETAPYSRVLSIAPAVVLFLVVGRALFRE